MQYHTVSLWRVLVILFCASFTAMGAERESHNPPEADHRSGYSAIQTFGGPSSAGSHLKWDNQHKGPLVVLEQWDHYLKPYHDFKVRLKERAGLSFGVDYNAVFQEATESPGESGAASGTFRVFGNWDLFGRASENTGSLVLKVENRHRLGTDIAPQALGPELGYAGLTAIPFSEADWLLSNLYWQQAAVNNRLGLVLGIVDVTDYVDVYSLADPWTGFFNLDFSTNPTIPAPNQGLGAALRGKLTDHLYLLAGIADANGDPTDPGDSFESFFTDTEYFKHAELGCYGLWKDRFEDNMHVTVWQIDQREEADIPEGWGAAFSASHLFNDRWLPFARFGLSDGGGGALLERSFSLGTGRYLRGKSDMVALGLSYGKPTSETGDGDLGDQYTMELFYRLQLFEHLVVTPDIQVLVNPAQNPDADVIGVFGVRARLAW